MKLKTPSKWKLHHAWLLYKWDKPKRNTFESRYKRAWGKINPNIDSELFMVYITKPVRLRRVI
mgnify:CR=1 FL=1